MLLLTVAVDNDKQMPRNAGCFALLLVSYTTVRHLLVCLLGSVVVIVMAVVGCCWLLFAVVCCLLLLVVCCCLFACLFCNTALARWARSS